MPIRVHFCCLNAAFVRRIPETLFSMYTLVRHIFVGPALVKGSLEWRPNIISGTLSIVSGIGLWRKSSQDNSYAAAATRECLPMNQAQSTGLNRLLTFSTVCTRLLLAFEASEADIVLNCPGRAAGAVSVVKTRVVHIAAHHPAKPRN